MAEEEYRRLRALGCVGANTVLVHGVGITADDIADAAPRIRAIVWCPSTNLYLLDKTLSPSAWMKAGGRVLLGSDSRLTADGDLLDEARAARATGSISDDALLDMLLAPSPFASVTHRADWLALPASHHLLDARRADLALVMRGGVPQIGSPALMAKFPHIPTVPALVDGVPKAIHAPLARQIARCSLEEPGLSISEASSPRRVFFLKTTDLRNSQ
jgi:hypothetical protein